MAKLLLRFLLKDYIRINPIPEQFKGRITYGYEREDAKHVIRRKEEYKKCSMETWEWWRELLKYVNIDNDL